jgi:hypothetical protein
MGRGEKWGKLMFDMEIGEVYSVNQEMDVERRGL